MSETWAAVLAISVAVMAILQLALVIGLAIVWRRLVAVARTSQQQLERVAADVKLNLGAVTARVNAVADDVLGVTARMQQVATTVSDGVQRVESFGQDCGTTRGRDSRSGARVGEERRSGGARDPRGASHGAASALSITAPSRGGSLQPFGLSRGRIRVVVGA